MPPTRTPSETKLLDTLFTIAQTPAPTFEESSRAKVVATRWQALGLQPQQDEVGNVVATIAGHGQPRVALAAHLDTVFEASTPLTIQHQADRVIGPGVGDNAASLAVLEHFIERALRTPPRCTLTLVATVGEEGLGDLRGAKHFLKQHAHNLEAFVAVDGYLGLVVDRAVGSRRYRAEFGTPGGHSWGNAGSPSAIQALGDAIHDLYRLPLSQDPRATLNVGTVAGGTSINSIAAQAELLLDLRSTDENTLETLELQAQQTLAKAANRNRSTLKLECVGTRPGGSTNNAALVKAAFAALQSQGIVGRTVVSSTDANAAVPLGLPSISLGVYKGGNAHRTDEWVEIPSLALGLEVLWQFVQHLA